MAGVYCFRVSGTVCHRIGHPQPNRDGERPKFAQLYINDTDNKIKKKNQTALESTFKA